MTLVELARQFDYLREAQSQGQNRGLRVEAVQHWSGGQQGDSWCLEMLWLWLDLFSKGNAPLARMQSVEAFHQFALAQGWIVDAPLPGDAVISINSAGIGHHVALITISHPLTAIAGNTSFDGLSSNGDGCYEHEIAAANKIFVRIPGVS